MRGETDADVTALLIAWRDGDETALARLTPIVYRELHRLAGYYMRREAPGHLLQPTALLNEAYLRLVDTSRVRWQNRAHFYAVAAQMMRRVLVDFARRRQFKKRGGSWYQVALSDAAGLAEHRDPDLADVDEALRQLEQLDARKARVVELRFFGGLSLEETAEALNVSTDTVGRDWRAAKAWLARELRR